MEIFERQVIEKDGELIIERLLPKKWELNDYSPTENLIEIEDTGDGHRFWVEPNDLFKRPFSLGLKVTVWNIEHGQSVGTAFTAELIRYDGRIYRKRCYLQAVFKPISDTTRPYTFNFNRGSDSPMDEKDLPF